MRRASFGATVVMLATETILARLQNVCEIVSMAMLRETTAFLARFHLAFSLLDNWNWKK
jgi:hypothetical protein